MTSSLSSAPAYLSRRPNSLEGIIPTTTNSNQIGSPMNASCSISSSSGSGSSRGSFIRNNRCGISSSSGSSDGGCSSSKRARISTPDSSTIIERVLLYAKHEKEEIFSALMLYPPNLDNLINAICAKFSYSVPSIANVYKKSKNNMTVKMDDIVVQNLSNESAYTIKFDVINNNNNNTNNNNINNNNSYINNNDNSDGNYCRDDHTENDGANFNVTLIEL
ncbi:hypothetical protein HELRODRAFT_188114 [Helobdella robusta]|uniref:GRHL1/CP2 C-terminal domain-containing protein n=1 Tax=Helobdella robusta TaxID=6412 RepID=T1FPN5_HELRO|nr:hypothetical protein HELRODRAFT_188114 [Helobdella robusta]ESO13115.1 hypothetical protein HELRODRAFT_188114 [Helobdella robusta]